MAKIRIREIEAHLGAIQKIIDDCRADITAEKAAGEDGAGSGLGAKTLEENDQPVKQDDPAEFPGSPKRPAITNTNMLVGAKDAAPAGIHNPSNGRTRVTQVFDTPRNPKDLKAIQPSDGVRTLHAIAEQFAADTKARSDALFSK